MENMRQNYHLKIIIHKGNSHRTKRHNISNFKFEHYT